MKPRIMFAVLSYGPIDPKVYNNHIARLVQWSRDYLMLFVHTDKHKCAQARNICVENAMQQGATHLLFVDSDHILPENMLNRLMATGVEVSSGLICKRYAPFPQVGYVRTETGGYKEVAFQPNSGVHRVDICAMGCTLIDMKVFNKIEKPWFIDVEGWVGDGPAAERFCKRHDVNFFEAVGKIGGKLVIDSNVEVGHMVDSEPIFPSMAVVGASEVEGGTGK